MQTRAQVGMAIGVGYILGRFQKMKWALALAGVGAAKTIGGSQGGLLRQGVKLVTSSPRPGRRCDLGRSASKGRWLVNSDRPPAPWKPFLPGGGASVAIDRESAARCLAGLVLTVMELLRELMERQAVRRVDQGDLTTDQVEQMGAALMALDERMTELCEHFELTRDDLSLDLGPLGPLLS